MVKEEYFQVLFTIIIMFPHEYTTILSIHLLYSISIIYVYYIAEVGMEECLQSIGKNLMFLCHLRK